MDDGRWTMGDGRWVMGDGRWAMGDGRWTGAAGPGRRGAVAVAMLSDPDWSAMSPCAGCETIDDG